MIDKYHIYGITKTNLSEICTMSNNNNVSQIYCKCWAYSQIKKAVCDWKLEKSSKNTIFLAVLICNWCQMKVTLCKKIWQDSCYPLSCWFLIIIFFLTRRIWFWSTICLFIMARKSIRIFFFYFLEGGGGAKRQEIKTGKEKKKGKMTKNEEEKEEKNDDATKFPKMAISLHTWRELPTPAAEDPLRWPTSSPAVLLDFPLLSRILYYHYYSSRLFVISIIIFILSPTLLNLSLFSWTYVFFILFLFYFYQDVPDPSDFLMDLQFSIQIILIFFLSRRSWTFRHSPGLLFFLFFFINDVFTKGLWLFVAILSMICPVPHLKVNAGNKNNMHIVFGPILIIYRYYYIR